MKKDDKLNTFDLNCDLGEGAPDDANIMPWIDSANIACGAHAGDAVTMRETIKLAQLHGVKIGAHPGYPDPANFGRLSMAIDPVVLENEIVRQITDLKSIAEAEGARLNHVKAHGALYNDAAKNTELADLLIRAVKRVDPGLYFMGLAGSVMTDRAQKAGLKTLHEGFADRRYSDDGSLVKRSDPDALITVTRQSIDQVCRMVLEGEVVSRSGKLIGMQIDTICIHGDQPGAAELARSIRKALFERITGITAHPLGDTAFMFRFGMEIDEKINHRVFRVYEGLKSDPLPGLTEMIPAYADLTLIYNPAEISWQRFVTSGRERMLRILSSPQVDDAETLGTINIPVKYGGEEGPDLAEVAKTNNLSEDEVVKRHLSGEYRVYMMGFTPGFAYLGGMNPSIATPRKKEPRLNIMAGSIGIAGAQTGIYPVDSPGGWQIIGRTSIKLFDPESDQPFLLKTGMRVRFEEETERRGDLETGRPREPENKTRGDQVSQSPSLHILSPGLLSTIQDAGRKGYRAFGMPVAGAMDRGAMQRANLLVGNDPDEAVIEMTFQGARIGFETMHIIALTGANMRPLINGIEQAMETALEVSRDDVLSFAGLTSGLRTYLAIAGGFDLPAMMGSRSTYLRASVGGFYGRALKEGDRVPVGSEERLGDLETGRRGDQENKRPGDGESKDLQVSKSLSLPVSQSPSLSVSPSLSLHFIPGPEVDRFTLEGLNTFLSATYTVSPQSDRMGMRLIGPTIEHKGVADILSSGVVPGTIQVTGDGKPIILLNDAQTTGGYTRIGCIVQSDLDRLAQAKPGDVLRFAQERLKE